MSCQMSVSKSIDSVLPSQDRAKAYLIGKPNSIRARELLLVLCILLIAE